MVFGLPLLGVGALVSGVGAVGIMRASWEFCDQPDQCARCGARLAPLAERAALAPADVPRALAYSAPSSFEVVQAAHRHEMDYTQQVLSEKPRDAQDPKVLPHILKALAGDNPVTFGRHGGEINGDALHMVHWIANGLQAQSQTWSLILDSPPQWSKATSNAEVLQSTRVRADFVREATERIARSLSVDESQVEIVDITEGSIKVRFTVQDLTSAEKSRILNGDITGKLKKQFDTMAKLEISPAVLAIHFDLDQLDEKGNKTFDGGSTFAVGPQGKERPYHQPGGWVRYGLKVLGKYGNDSWLHPFQNPNNWYRAFHGTGRAGCEGATAAKSIYEGGFKPSAKGAFGPGVYTSPFAPYSENGYAGKVCLETQAGKKSFSFILQVAVDPAKIIREGYPANGGRENHEWVVQADGVRPYGLLIKEG